MLLRNTLPRFHAEAKAAIASKPDDEFPEGTSRSEFLAQLDDLIFVRGNRHSGSFCVAMPERLGMERPYAFSWDFDIPSGNVIADLDLDLQITGFEPISLDAIRDLQEQLGALE